MDVSYAADAAPSTSAGASAGPHSWFNTRDYMDVIQPGGMGRILMTTPSITSTQEFMRQHGGVLPPGCVLVANQQTSGKGGVCMLVGGGGGGRQCSGVLPAGTVCCGQSADAEQREDMSTCGGGTPGCCCVAQPANHVPATCCCRSCRARQQPVDLAARLPDVQRSQAGAGKCTCGQAGAAAARLQDCCLHAGSCRAHRCRGAAPSPCMVCRRL